MRVGIIGFGYWGEKVARCFSQAQRAEVARIADTAPARRDEARRRFPQVHITSQARHVFDDATIDALVIATPSNTHGAMAVAALEAGKHTWIEKPVAETADQARALAALAQQRDRVLFIDHTFIYSGSVRLLKTVISERRLGDVLHYNSMRTNNGKPRRDCSIFHDLAIHDLSILDVLVAESPAAVLVTGAPASAADMSSGRHIRLAYPSGLSAAICVDWCAPAKARRVVIGSADQSVEFDDMEPEHKIRLYEFPVPATAEFSFRAFDADRANGRILPLDSPREALANAVDEFVRCIETGTEPVSNGRQGVRLAAVVDACLLSAEATGQWIKVAG